MKFIKMVSFCLWLIIILLLVNCKDDVTEPTPRAGSNALEPADGQCLFIIGQSSNDYMEAYIREVRSMPVPAGFAYYTSLSGRAVQEDLPRYKAFMENYPFTVLQLAIWTGERQWGDPGYYLDEIIRGEHNQDWIL